MNLRCSSSLAEESFASVCSTAPAVVASSLCCAPASISFLRSTTCLRRVSNSLSTSAPAARCSFANTKRWLVRYHPLDFLDHGRDRLRHAAFEKTQLTIHHYENRERENSDNCSPQ